MNIEHLKLFARVARTNNISLAGNEQGLSPAVASAYISKLEQGLGVRLVHRTTRKVSLTADGKAFLPHAEEVLMRVENARASVGSGSITATGTLRISAPASFGRMHIAPALADFFERFPEIDIDLRLSDSIIDMVDGGFDIAVRDSRLSDSSLVARKLAKDHRMLIASPAYLKKFGTPASIDDLAGHNFLNLIGMETWSLDTPDGPVAVKTSGNFRADNGEAVRDACAAGLGIAVSSSWCAYKQILAGKVVPVMTDFPLIHEAAIWAVYPSSRLVAPKVRAFIDFFAELYGDTPYWDKALSTG
ncbi:LysR family transcriptional regulator [Thalassotalea euphylliae]|uniref:LysR family transcriptional regulator n=1 Tax=Thalassotalea euphylliae TaxID=1655234 RepID=UPI00362A23BE